MTSSPTRQEENIIKLQTKFGNLYIQIAHIGQRITGVHISAPGKFSDTTIGTMLDEINKIIDDEIEKIENGDYITPRPDEVGEKNLKELGSPPPVGV